MSKLSDSDILGNGGNGIDATVGGDSLSFSLSENIALEMVRIPAGKYRNGSLKGGQFEEKINFDYWIGKFPVTQEQYEVMLGQNPSCFKNAKSPVDNLSLNDAECLCQMLNNKFASQLPHGYHFHIPTIAQWEYACRAGVTTQLNNGEDLQFLNDGSSPNLNEIGWYVRNSEEKTHPVGKKQPNRWGLYDMHGNIQEYCSDVLRNRYPSEHRIHNNLIKPCNSNDYFLKGGGYASQAQECVIESQECMRNIGKIDKKKKDFGLRLVLASEDKIIGSICNKLARKTRLLNKLGLFFAFLGGGLGLPLTFPLIFMTMDYIDRYSLSFSFCLLYVLAAFGGVLLCVLCGLRAESLEFKYLNFYNEYDRLKIEEGKAQISYKEIDNIKK